MTTLNLKQASKLVNMHWQTLRRMAKNGLAPGSKPAKSWVFIEEDLLDWIRSGYGSPRQVPEGKETQWHSSNVKARNIGKPDSQYSGKRYADLLGLRTKS